MKKEKTKIMEIGISVVAVLVEPIVHKVKIFAKEQARGLSNVAWRHHLQNLLKDVKMEKLDLLLSVDGAQTIYNLERILEKIQEEKIDSSDQSQLLNYINCGEQAAVRAREMSKASSLDVQLLACRMVTFIRLLKSSLTSSNVNEIIILQEFKHSFENMIIEKYGQDILTKTIQWEENRQKLLVQERVYINECEARRLKLNAAVKRRDEFVAQYPALSDGDWINLNTHLFEDVMFGLIILPIFTKLHSQYLAKKYKVTRSVKYTYLDYYWKVKTTYDDYWRLIHNNDDYCKRPSPSDLSELPEDHGYFSSSRIYASVMQMLKKQQSFAKELK